MASQFRFRDILATGAFGVYIVDMADARPSQHKDWAMHMIKLSLMSSEICI